MIYQYVLKHEGATKAEVIRFMDGKSSVATTHKIIKDFIQTDKFVVSVDKDNSQMHHLYINDRNEFNIINKQLSKLELLGDVLDKTIVNLSNVLDKRKGKDTYERPNKNNLDAPLSARDLIHLGADLGFFVDAVKQMLDILLIQTNNLIHSERDSQIFYIRISKLMVRMMRHKENTGLVDPIKAIEVQQALLQVQKTDIDKMPPFMIEKDLLSCAMKEGIIKTDFVSELKSITKSFREAFSNN